MNLALTRLGGRALLAFFGLRCGSSAMADDLPRHSFRPRDDSAAPPGSLFQNREDPTLRV